MLSPKQRAFLSAYAESGSLSAAQRAAKVTRRSHYYWLHQAEYAAAFQDAREEMADWLETEARRRALGVEKPVFYRGKLCYRQEIDPETGQRRNTGEPLMVRKYSDVLLMFLLKGARPEKYRDNWKGANSRRASDPAKQVKVTFVNADGAEK